MLNRSLAALFVAALLGCTPAHAQNVFPTPDGRTTAGGSVQMCLNASSQAVPCTAAATQDTTGAQFVNTEGRKATYRAAGNNNITGAPTDICVIGGSATKLVSVTSVRVSGTAATAVRITTVLIK